MEERRIYWNKKRMAIAMLLGILFFLIGILIFAYVINSIAITRFSIVLSYNLIIWAIEIFVALISVIFGAVGSIKIIKRFIQPLPFLIINNKGIDGNSYSKNSDIEMLRWHDIKDINIVEKRINKLLILKLDENSAYLNKQPYWKSKVLRLNNKAYQGDYVINFFSADISVYEAYTIITEYLDQFREETKRS